MLTSHTQTIKWVKLLGRIYLSVASEFKTLFKYSIWSAMSGEPTFLSFKVSQKLSALPIPGMTLSSSLS